MKKLIGLNKTKTAIFISGAGSNLKNLIKFSFQENSPISIKLVISNNKKTAGLKYANQQKIEKKIINFNRTKISRKKSNKFSNKKKNSIYLSCWLYESFIT